MTTKFNLSSVHDSWHECLSQAINQLDPEYRAQLDLNTTWLPGHEKLFNAFSLPMDDVKYVLLGESPYPRAVSANGYAFWDANVGDIWIETGLSKQVNRATSLRNFIKMLLVAEGLLSQDNLSQAAIAKINKQELVQTNTEFFQNLLSEGFLLLNATLVLEPNFVRKHAKAWRPFLHTVLHYLFKRKSHVQLILFGNIATEIDKIIEAPHIQRLVAEHPYNLTFVVNSKVINFFKPFHLLKKKA